MLALSYVKGLTLFNDLAFGLCHTNQLVISFFCHKNMANSIKNRLFYLNILSSNVSDTCLGRQCLLL